MGGRYGARDRVRDRQSVGVPARPPQRGAHRHRARLSRAAARKIRGPPERRGDPALSAHGGRRARCAPLRYRDLPQRPGARRGRSGLTRGHGPPARPRRPARPAGARVAVALWHPGRGPRASPALHPPGADRALPRRGAARAASGVLQSRGAPRLVAGRARAAPPPDPRRVAAAVRRPRAPLPSGAAPPLARGSIAHRHWGSPRVTALPSPPSPDRLRLSVIVPAYNEAATIEAVVRRLNEVRLRPEIIA